MQLSLAEFGLVFSTRDRGSRIRADLLGQIADSPEGVIIDFAKVLNASYSFIDEFIGKLAEQIDAEQMDIVNASPTITRTIKKSLQNRGLDANRVLACLQYA